MRGILIIMLKAPRAGAVKTRLAAGVGAGRAAALFRIMTAHTIREAEKSGATVVLAVDPPSAMSGWNSLWPPHLPRVAQGRGDLGQRMTRVMNHAPPGPVVLIGADAPGLRARHIREAFSKLRGADAVFGPADDGGYWLIGLARRRAAPDLFRGVRWSTEHALAETVASLPGDFRIGLLGAMTDIDDERDLMAIELSFVKQIRCN